MGAVSILAFPDVKHLGNQQAAGLSAAARRRLLLELTLNSRIGFAEACSRAEGQLWFFQTSTICVSAAVRETPGSRIAIHPWFWATPAVMGTQLLGSGEGRGKVTPRGRGEHSQRCHVVASPSRSPQISALHRRHSRLIPSDCRVIFSPRPSCQSVKALRRLAARVRRSVLVCVWVRESLDSSPCPSSSPSSSSPASSPL